MNALFLAVIFAVMQTLPPVPSKAPDNSSRGGESTQQKTKNDQSTPTPTAPTVDANASPQSKANGGGIPAENAPQSIKVAEFPPVTVTKDWTDRAYWTFNGFLVIVGFLQVWLLFRTLKTTNRQADIAEAQKAQIILSGEQTERIINQMKDTTQKQLRAYLGVSECCLKLEPPNIPEGQVSIKNFGQTPARKVRQWIGIAIFPQPLVGQLPEPPEGMQTSVSIISPGSHHINVAPVKVPIRACDLPSLYTPEHSVYVYGRVAYEDIFENEWSTNYRFFCGGPDGLRTKEDSRGVLLGLMQPDSEGNYQT
jgi:hypothetical protein